MSNNREGVSFGASYFFTRDLNDTFLDEVQEDTGKMRERTDPF